MTSRFLLFPLLLLSSLMAGCQPDNQECSGDELQSRWFRDLDGDGFGVSSDVRFSCSAPTGYAPVDGDCLDSDPRFYPLAVETSSELSDFNCDGVVSFQVIPADGVDPVTLYSPDYGELTLHIPPNALQGSEPVTLSVEVNDELNTAARPLLPYALSPVISFSPSQNFQTPITVTYPLPPWFVALDPEVTCTALGVIQLDELSAEPLWPFIPATRCELAAGSIDVELAHFSSYQVGMDADNNGQLELVGLELGPRYAEDAPIVEQHKALSVESGDALAERLYYSMAGVPVEGALEKLKWKQLRKPEALSWSTGQEPAFEERTCSSGEGCTNKYVLTAQPQNSGTQAVVEELLIWAEDVALAGTVCGMSQALYTHCSFDDGGTGMMNTMQELGATPISVTEDNDCDWTGTLWDLGTDGFPDPFECVLVQVTLNDDDQDGVSKENGDCNDNNPNIKPGATELTGDSVDQNCDGLETCYTDADLDNFAISVTRSSTDTDCNDPGEGTSAELTQPDCDDDNANIKPGVAELAGDSLDQNCDGLETCFKDADNDGFRPDDASTAGSTDTDCYDANEAVSADPTTDCDDSNGSVKPGATESCNAVDDNCDGSIDEGVKLTFYQDADADAFGNPTSTAQACAAPTGYVSNNLDCDDASASVKPGATESCNAVDDNCDGSIDEGVKLTFYQDADADAFGNPTSTAQACTVPTGYVSNNLDCNDADASLNPNTLWTLDYDADGFGEQAQSVTTRSCTPPTRFVLDHSDCNDSSAAVKPGATELAGDSIDQNCDGQETCYKDADDDGYRPDSTSTVLSADSDCTDSKEAVSTDPTGDCNDSSAAVKPGATELAGDSIDQNCDGQETCYKDADDDGYRPDSTSTVLSADSDCTDSKEAVSTDPTGDCNDTNSSVKPGATELAGDSIDQNCDGQETCYKDADDDGYRPDSTSTVLSADSDCTDSKEAVSTDPTGDCNDSSAAVKPGATELAGDSIDQNCDGQETCYKDADDDGYRPDSTTTVPSTDSDCTDAKEAVSTDPTGDCNDSSAAVKPGATELAGDSIDQNCDGQETCYKDADDDGYRPDSTSTVLSADSDCTDSKEAVSTDPTGDCNDSSAAVKPGATELAGDSIDQNCDGQETCYKDADDDGYRPDSTSTVLSADSDCTDSKEAVSTDPTGDCNDTNSSVKPGATELAGDSIDQNCDGQETCYKDADDDGYRPDSTSTVPSTDSDCTDAKEASSTDPTGDCNDADATLNPNTEWSLDWDGDGYGDSSGDTLQRQCLQPEGYVLDATDCNDEDEAVHPDALEYPGNLKDDDCDGVESDIVQVAADVFHSLAVDDLGRVWAWGNNDHGQLGDGTPTDRYTPVLVSSLSGVTAVATGWYHSLAVKLDGTVWAWGNNDYGQLGDGTPTDRYTPVLVSSLSGVTAVAAGDRHSLAVKLDGTVWAWGYNGHGQLGDGTTTSRSTPVQVSGLSGVTAVAAGGYHSLAVKSDGTVWAWGYNGSGQLGDGTTTSRSTPVQVSGLTGVTAVAASYGYSLAVKSDGTVWAWGRNSEGQLGDGTTTERSTPVQVSSISGVRAVAAGGYHSLAVKLDGTVWAWGWNDYGQLGDGTTTDRKTPVQVSSISGVTAVAAGWFHSLAVKSDGTVWAWGDNYYGQLGDGTTTSRSTPQPVLWGP